jgi:hypothetical protein
MAKIYMGNQEAADRGLLEALRRLGDTYHVFVEFQIPNLRGQRQVDFLVIREDPIKPCIFCLEVKMERRRLRGTINGPWEYEEGPGNWRILPVSNPRDQNPIQQAYNTARTMQSWLGSMRALIQEPDQPWGDVPTVFPRLVLPVAHPDNQLQTDSFTWRFDGYERCLDSLTTFIPRDPVPLSAAAIERLARHLGVQRLPDAEPEVETTDLPNWIRSTLSRMSDELVGLRQEVRELRLALGTRPAAHLPPGTRYSAPSPPPRPTPAPGRDLEQAYRMLVEVIRDLRSAGRKLVFPNVQEGLWRRLGQFDVEQYGFFKFKEFLQEAERRGIVRLSVIDGVDYVSLPGEEPQVAPAGAPSSLEDLTPDERVRFIDTIAQLEARSAYMIRSYIARHLTASGILPLPMYEVRALVNDAVTRGLFQRGSRPFRHPATGEMQSLETLTLDPGHPWVAEALARPGDEAEDGATWDDYGPGEGRWTGSRQWASEDGDADTGEQRESPTEDDAWNGEGAAAEATTPPWSQPGADWQAAESEVIAGANDADTWDDPYTHQTHQWSLAAAEADLHGPEDEASPPAYNPDENTADGVAPVDGDQAESLPGALARSGNGHEGNGLADPYQPWQPPVAAVHEHSTSADYGDEEPGETIH